MPAAFQISMRFTFRHFLVLGALFSTFCLGVGLFAAHVRFQPDGVPLAKRAEYERILTQLREEEQQTASLDETEVPTAHCDEPAFDFGRIDPHATLSHTFTIKNVGKRELYLSDAGSSCKCTLGKIGSPVVPPGGQTDVLVSWNTGYQTEEYQQQVSVRTNDPKQPILKLSVQGTIRANLATAEPELTLPAKLPGHQTSVEAYVFSQAWDDFLIDSVTSPLPGFDWSAEPVDISALPSGDLEAKSAWKLSFMCAPTSLGSFIGKVNVVASPISGSESASCEFRLTGRTLKAFEFKSPHLHEDQGLDLGVMVNDRSHEKSVLVKVRDESRRNIEVLDIQPRSLQATLTPTKVPGNYRLAIVAPRDARATIFNLRTSQGYVQVGDPNDREFSSWLPLTGVIIQSTSHSFAE